MAQFLADIAGMLELFAIAAGLALLHRAAKDGSARLLKIAGWVLVVGGIAVGLCTGYYWFKYQAQGGFDSASAWPGATMDDAMHPGSPSMGDPGRMPGMEPGGGQP